MPQFKLFLFSTVTFLMLSLLFCFTTEKTYASGNTCTWIGAGGNDNFSTAANWSGCGGAPSNGDSLIIPSTSNPVLYLNNDISGLSVSTINGGGELNGNPLTVTSQITGMTFYNTVYLGGNVTIQGTYLTDINLNGNNLVINGDQELEGISGKGNITVENGGTDQFNTLGYNWTGTLTIAPTGIIETWDPSGDSGVVKQFGNASNTIIIDNGGSIWVETQEEGQNLDLPQNIILNGAADGASLLYISGYEGFETAPGTLSLQGKLTLASNAQIGGNATDIITGPILGKYNISLSAGQDNSGFIGALLICSSDNLSLTPNNNNCPAAPQNPILVKGNTLDNSNVPEINSAFITQATSSTNSMQKNDIITLIFNKSMNTKIAGNKTWIQVSDSDGTSAQLECGTNVSCSILNYKPIINGQQYYEYQVMQISITKLPTPIDPGIILVLQYPLHISAVSSTIVDPSSNGLSLLNNPSIIINNN